MERRFKFTKDAIKSIKPPTSGSKAYYYDTETRGLELQVSPAGQKVFYFYRKFKGTPIRVRIGLFPDLAYQKAQGKAHEYNSCIAEGIDPRGIGPSIRGGLTLSQLFDAFLIRAKRPPEEGGKRTWAEDVRQFNKSLKKFHHRKIDAITRNDLQALYDQMVRENGKYTANRLVALVKTLYNYGYKREYFSGKNPAIGVEKLQEKSRNRRLKDHEFSGFLEALDNEPNHDMRDIFLLLLLTGARKSNVLEMRWEDIDWEKETWLIQRTKNEDALIVPLEAHAIEILKTRHSHATSEWVFPSNSKAGHITEVKTAWKRIMKDAGIEDFRIHDLRRTNASIQADQGIDLLTIGRSLGHRSQAATMVYAHPSDAVLRDAKIAVSMVINGHRKPKKNSGAS